VSKDKIEKKLFLRAFSVLIGIGVLFGSSYVFSSKTQADVGFVPIPVFDYSELKKSKDEIFNTKTISLWCSAKGYDLLEMFTYEDFERNCFDAISKNVDSDDITFPGFDDDGLRLYIDGDKPESQLLVALNLQPLLMKQKDMPVPNTGGNLSDLYSLEMSVSRKSPMRTTLDLVQTVVFVLPNKPDEYKKYKEEIFSTAASMLNRYFVDYYNERHKGEVDKTAGATELSPLDVLCNKLSTESGDSYEPIVGKYLTSKSYNALSPSDRLPKYVTYNLSLKTEDGEILVSNGVDLDLSGGIEKHFMTVFGESPFSRNFKKKSDLDAQYGICAFKNEQGFFVGELETFRRIED
jgi:hypothetical protein